MPSVTPIEVTNYKTSDGQLFHSIGVANRHQEILDTMIGGITDLLKAKFDEIEEALIDEEHQHEDTRLELEVANKARANWEGETKHTQGQLDECKQKYIKLQEATHEDGDGYWAWQPEGGNYIETLTCMILIDPVHLREIIAASNKHEEASDSLRLALEYVKKAERIPAHIQGLVEQTLTKNPK